MAKCPRSGAKLTTPSGAVVKAVPIGFHGRHRSNAVCIQEGGETMVSVVRDGRKVLMPLAQLTPMQRTVVAPPTHLMPRQHEAMPNLFPQPMPQDLQGIDETDTLRLYGSCVKKCRRHAPHSLGPCIDKCQEKGGSLGSAPDEHKHWAKTRLSQAQMHLARAESAYVAKRCLEAGQEIDYTYRALGEVQAHVNSAGPLDHPLQTMHDLVLGRLSKLDEAFESHCVRESPGLGQFLCAPQDLAGTEDFHARNAQIWAGHAVDEAQQGAADALDRGQCGRALSSLVRAERKTTMASTHATQIADDRLRAEARASNDLVNAMWREFKEKCVRGSDTPGSVSPFGGLGGAGSLHERIAAVLGWSVKDTQGFSLPMLREMVREKDPQLAQEISDIIQGGGHIYRRDSGA